MVSISEWRRHATGSEEPVNRSRGCGIVSGQCGRGSERVNARYSTLCAGDERETQRSVQFSRVFEFSTVRWPDHCFFHLCSITMSSTSGSPWRASATQRPVKGMYGQLDAVYRRVRGAGERATDESLYGMYWPLSRIFEFSILAGPDRQSRCGRARERKILRKGQSQARDCLRHVARESQPAVIQRARP